MRVAAGLLTLLYAGVVFQALAAEPPPPPPSPTASTPAEQQSATAPAGEHGATAPAVTTPAGAQPAATPAAATPAAATQFTRDEQDLIARGYKPEMRHGQRWFCRREGELGSRFEKKSCNTVESILAQRAASEETVRRMQANKPGISN
jgi:hypothetical protein